MSTIAQHKDLMILSGHTYHNRKFELPEGWQELTSYSATKASKQLFIKKEMISLLAIEDRLPRRFYIERYTNWNENIITSTIQKCERSL